MAIVNLILFVCFGLLSLNKAYEYFNNVYVNYMKEQINAIKKLGEASPEVPEVPL